MEGGAIGPDQINGRRPVENAAGRRYHLEAVSERLLTASEIRQVSRRRIVPADEEFVEGDDLGAGTLEE